LIQDYSKLIWFSANRIIFERQVFSGKKVSVRMADRTKRFRVLGRDGELGWIDPKEQSPNSTDVLIRLTNGQAIMAPKDLMVVQENGDYYLPFSSEQFAEGGEDGAERQRDQDTLMVVPVLMEKANISKRLSARVVRVSKKVTEHEERIENAGFTEKVTLERVPINVQITVIPQIHTEGNTTVIPVVEEVLIIEKRLVLREEVRVTVERIENEPKQFTLRSERIEIERSDPGQTALTEDRKPT
jgi:stress response protein YsnF